MSINPPNPGHILTGKKHLSTTTFIGLIIISLVAVFLLTCEDSAPDEPMMMGSSATITQALEESARYIVVFEPGKAAGGQAAVAQAGKILREIRGVEAVAVELPSAALEGLRHNPNIALIEKDPLRMPLAESVPYGIPMVQADLVDDGFTANRLVCIIDSGYYAAHEDLASGSNISGDMSVAGPWSEDGCGHGTHVAGTIAALGNDVGVLGVNPGGALGLHIVRVFGDNCGWAYASDLIDAAYACRDAGANVISMSLGCADRKGLCASVAEENAFQDLYDNYDILSVAAASNDGRTWYSYPASYDSVVSVAAIDENEEHPRFSNSNSQVELAAPGVAVLSTVPPGCTYCGTSGLYEYWSGTSMATPHVSAVAALVWSHNTDWSNLQIRMALQESARDIGALGWDKETGFGIVQAKAALDALGGGEPECLIDADCDDANECTTDSCSSGSCLYAPLSDDSVCVSGLCCDGGCVPVECSSDVECGDANECTTDACENPSTCAAACVSADVVDETVCTDGLCCSGACVIGADTCDLPAFCGDGYCEGLGVEDGLSCPEDCRCVGKQCSNANCGDGLCTPGENVSKCPVDCI